MCGGGVFREGAAEVSLEGMLWKEPRPPQGSEALSAHRNPCPFARDAQGLALGPRYCFSILRAIARSRRGIRGSHHFLFLVVFGAPTRTLSRCWGHRRAAALRCGVRLGGRGAGDGGRCPYSLPRAFPRWLRTLRTPAWSCLWSLGDLAAGTQGAAFAGFPEAWTILPRP